jgi:NDP-sugar pyrophosphorylase family protein
MLMKNKISITIENSILKQIDTIIDNIYIRNRSQAIEHLVSIALGENRTAVILAGGDESKIKIGNDYRSTVKIRGKEVVERAVEKLRESGFKNIFIVARQELLTKVFNTLKDGSVYGVKVNYIEEKKSNGTADSLKLVKGRVENDFLVVYGDILFSKINLEEIWNDHIKQNALATIMMTTSSKPSEKGTLKVEGNKVLTFTQKPKESDIYLVFSPIFVATPEILEYVGASLEKDVFPQIASRNLLNGHLSSEKEVHVHNAEDVRSLNK